MNDIKNAEVLGRLIIEGLIIFMLIVNLPKLK